jgi:hypothetical protein
MKYIVLVGPVDHDGARYEKGDEISLLGDQGAALVAVGAVRAVKAAGKDSKPPEADKSPEADKPPAG